MRLLLDTHIAIWGAGDPKELTPGERELIATTAMPTISAVSIWETRLKWNSFSAAGLRKGVMAPDVLLRFVTTSAWQMLPLADIHAVTTLDTQIAHRDPFDELLLVQAQVEGLRLLTRDRALLGHPLALFA